MISTVSPTLAGSAFLSVSAPTAPLNTTWVGVSVRMTAITSTNELAAEA